VPRVYVSGAFDDFGFEEVRFLEAASRFGAVRAFIWSDALVHARSGNFPKFPLPERLYLAHASRWIDEAIVTADVPPEGLPLEAAAPGTWVVRERDDTGGQRDKARARGLDYHVARDRELSEIPAGEDPSPALLSTSAPRVIVTGSFDWMHSGHVRFFEEASGLGVLYVVVGSDQNIRLLKGDGHPAFPECKRRYLVHSVRSVSGTFISTGSGWMDAAPEIERMRPTFYAVNEDGDKPEKRDFCSVHGIEYVVLKRIPREGLPPRSSTELRGF